MSTLKTHNLQSPDAGSVNITMTPNSGVIVTGISTFTGNIDANGDLDVDGQTNLDHVSVVGATTCTGGAVFLNSISLNASTNNYLYFNDNLNFTRNGHGNEMTIDSSGRVLINTTTTYSSNQMMIVKGASPTSGGNRPYDGQLAIESTETSGAINTGGVLAFIGHDGGTARGFGSIRNLKEDGTSGNYGTYMSFETRANGSAPTERLRIDSAGNLSLGKGAASSTNYGKNFQIHDTGTSGATLHLTTSQTGSSNSDGFHLVQQGAHLYHWLRESGDQVFATGANERMRIDSSGRVVIGGSSAYIGGAALAVLGTGTTPNTYGSFAIGKVGANPTAGTTLANIRLNGGSVGTRRGAEINAIANSNWSDGSSHPTKLTFAVANVNSASATQRFEINHYGHMVFTNENVFASSSSPGTNGFKGLTQLGYQHWGQRQYYSGQQNLTQNGYFDLFSNNTNHDDIIFWLNIKGFHGNRTFGTAHGAIGGYGLSVSYQSASGMYGTFSGVDVSGTGGARRKLRWTSTSPYSANWWIWGWISGTSLLTTHTGYTAAQLH